MWDDLLNYVSEKTSLVIDQGLTADIMHFFESCSKIIDFKISAPDRMVYHVDVALSELDKLEITQIFSDLVLLIQYSELTAYTKEVEEGTITYQLVSVGNKTGFRCVVRFSSSV